MRLIDAEEFIKKCKKIVFEEYNNKVKVNWATAYDNFIDEINEQPTVDAVPVVRCKDCKHYECHYCWRQMKTYLARVSDMDYCSCGERRDNNDTNTN